MPYLYLEEICKRNSTNFLNIICEKFNWIHAYLVYLCNTIIIKYKGL